MDFTTSAMELSPPHGVFRPRTNLFKFAILGGYGRLGNLKWMDTPRYTTLYMVLFRYRLGGVFEAQRSRRSEA